MTDGIDEILKNLDQNNGDKDRELEETKDNLPDATDEESLMAEVVKMTLEDRKHADDLYNVFLPEVSMGKDHSEGSKEAMVRAVELKINAARNIIDLIKIKKTGDGQKNSFGVFIGGNTMSQKKAGINIANIKEEFNE